MRYHMLETVQFRANFYKKIGLILSQELDRKILQLHRPQKMFDD